TAYAGAFSLPLSHVIVRVDGLYGNKAPLNEILSHQCGVIGNTVPFGVSGSSCFVHKRSFFLWPLSNEGIANRHLDTLDALEQAQVQRCRQLILQPDIVRALTLFHWWPAHV